MKSNSLNTELRAISAQKQTQQTPAKEKRRLTTRSIQDILMMTFPEDEIVWKNGYLSKGERAVWCGMGGIGKSRLVLQMAVRMRLGREFFGWPTEGKELRWLFLQTENNNRRLQADLKAMTSSLTAEEIEHLSNGVSFHTLESETDGMVWLDKPETAIAVEDAFVESLPDIVVFDPLRDFTTGNLNDDGDMSKVTGLLAGIAKKGNPQRIPLVIHHAGTGKAGIAKVSGADRSSFGRNSKVLYGWTRSQINIAPAFPDSNDVLIVGSGKNNNAEEFKTFAVRLDPSSMMYERDDSFDMSNWESEMSDTSNSRKPTVETLQNLVTMSEESKVEKTDAISKLREQGASKREAEDLIKEALKNQLKEIKEKRSGKRDAVFLAFR